MGMKSLGLKHALLMGAAAFGMGTAALAPLPAYAQEATRSYDIPAQDLDDALREFGRQTGRDVLFTPDAVAGKRSGALVGQMTERQALQSLLAGSGLRFEQTASGGYAVQDPNSPTRLGDADGAASSEGDGYSEILVVGRRTLNADIRRSEDDAQPYVVFDAEDIERSGATDLNDFFRTRLPMNAASSSRAQASTGTGGPDPTSRIDLRGLGVNETLVLVDGRRIPGVSTFGELIQGDINGIPLTAIDRIEILPSTASGIYGGGATGGVVNIILKRDFSGITVRGTYAGTFQGGAAEQSFDISGGRAFDDGRTQIMFSASQRHSDELEVGDRDFRQRARNLILENNPSQILGAVRPPLGATANILSASGPLTLDPVYGGTALGSTITHIPTGYLGASSDNAAALVGNAGTYNLNVPNDSDLIGSPESNSIDFSVRRELWADTEAFLDIRSTSNEGSYNGPTANSAVRLPASAPNNPFQQDIYVFAPNPALTAEFRTRSEVLSATSGVIVNLPGQWRAAGEFSWSQSTFGNQGSSPVINDAGSLALQTGLATGGRPTLNILQDATEHPLNLQPYLLRSPNTWSEFESVQRDATIRLSGPLLNLPAGPVIFSGLAEVSNVTVESAIEERTDSTTGAPFFRYFPQQEQEVRSAYGELRVPVFSSANRLPLLQELEVQASVRFDQYELRSVNSAAILVPSRDGPFPSLPITSQNESAEAYTAGLRYVPFDGLTIRASYGTGFLPPTVFQIVPTEQVFDFSAFHFGIYPDPLRGGASGPFIASEGPVTLVGGGNPQLRPEESESFSLGAIIEPEFLPGLRVSVDYTRITKTDEIRPADFIFLLANEAAFSDRITRAPLTPDDISHGYTGGRITRIDQTLLNAAATEVRAYDFQLDYDMPTARFGDFKFYAIATWIPEASVQTLATVPSVDTAGYSDGPLAWRGNFGVTWESGPWTLGWNGQYYDDYLAYTTSSSPSATATTVLTQGSSTIPSQSYYDFSAIYRLDDPALPFGLDRASIALGIQNVFDESPPIVAQSFGGYSTYGDPRLRRITLTLSASF